ncbi:hybrid sensor histidine kinase/response regulator [Planctomyces sp. SH-PL62]|uniref:hybrid sensor histidine kinase/response regulator n=1 Tax=Planctomyces sp. SH-PL62 TaxID=1636152 RepID=UPI00078E8D9F|nr:hybrid sensor histidine kinase/response regulator [Planctomyces sp. SH-PL62]AMV40871.1 Alginate biosynthesis sensor protein KinB [Planctomyces sp. SH-PL62]
MKTDASASEVGMSEKPIRLMLIDDDEEDYLLTRDLLEGIADIEIELDWLADADRAVDVICDGGCDLYLVDYSLGRIDGLAVIREALARGASAPMILLTGLDERAIDLDAMRAGAADFLEKWRLNPTLLERSIRYSLQEKQHAEELERRVQERTTELARANSALQAQVAERVRAEEALRTADRRKDEYLSTLAHELRNPLVPIRNALEIMRLAGSDPAVFEPSRAMIERQVKHLIRLIDDLMVVARISRGMIKLKYESSSAERLTATAVENLQPFLTKRRHDFQVDLAEGLPPLRVDSERLVQVLYNLLHNAAKYTQPGGRIRLGVEPEGDGVLFRVRDDGPGIPRDMLQAVFEIFFQVKRPDDDGVASGLGVGLWLVKRIVELHGGRVEARSGADERGSEFLAWIPATPPDAEE